MVLLNKRSPVTPLDSKAMKHLERLLASTQVPTDLDRETQDQLWSVGLWFPIGAESRSLAPEELTWLQQAALTEYLRPDQAGRSAIGFTAPPGAEVDALDWYLRPDDYWPYEPIELGLVMQQFPIDRFQLTAKGQPPNLVPDFAYDLSATDYRTTMRSLTREFYRTGWSLSQYKWFVMVQFAKTTAQLSPDEFAEVVALLKTYPDAEDDE